MTRTAYRATLFALYQLSIAAGIALLPLSLATRRLGLTLPAGRLIESIGEAYESASTSA